MSETIKITNKNTITISGEVVELNGSFTKGKVEFNEITVSVPRLSGVLDYINIVYKSSCVDEPIDLLDHVKFTGSIRSRSVERSDGHRGLSIYVYVDTSIEVNTTRDNINEFELEGYVCKEVISRKTPFGRRVTDVFLANNGPARSYYLPMIGFGQISDKFENLSVGDKLICKGRFQSRIYSKTLDTGEVLAKTAFELLVSDFEKVDEQ